MPYIGNIPGRRRRGKETSRDLMSHALSAIGLSDNYEDLSLICHTYWGWELPTLTTEQEDLLMDDYDKVQVVFEQIKEERKSSMAVEYRVFRQLWHRGFPCHPHDFKIVTTEEIVDYYEEKFKKICSIIVEELGWLPFVSIYALTAYNYDTLQPPRISM